MTSPGMLNRALYVLPGRNSTISAAADASRVAFGVCRQVNTRPWSLSARPERLQENLRSRGFRRIRKIEELLDIRVSD
jgi:hypothetical protein